MMMYVAQSQFINIFVAAYAQNFPKKSLKTIIFLFKPKNKSLIY